MNSPKKIAYTFITRFTLLLFVLLSGLFIKSKAQSVEASVELSSVASNSNTAPFWLQSNRNGIFAYDGDMILNRIQLYSDSKHTLFDKTITLKYGADLIARSGNRSESLSFNQFFLKLNAFGVELSAGRFQSPSPFYSDKLGMGSLGVSGNAVPIPQIRLGLSSWSGIPFTNNYVEVTGYISHGWLVGNRFTDNVLYHEKSGYVRFGDDLPLNIYAGLNHFAKWGGKNNPQFGNLPSKFSDFWRVFFALSGDDEAPPADADFMLGDHLGNWDFGFSLDLEAFHATFYRQHPLETKDNLKLKSLQDALNGISIRPDPSLGIPVKEFVYEFMYTKWQDGPRSPNFLNDGTPCSETDRCRDDFQGNENYYNHGIYRTGWVTHGRTIGNPLFRVSDLSLNRFGEGIDNNRIIAHHVGLEFQYRKTNLIGKITKSKNFGTRRNPFPERKDQNSVGLFSETHVLLFDHPFIAMADVAWDIGDLFGNQIGVMVGIRWEN